MFYYLSIGSNINPATNVVKVLSWLAETFGCAVVYPVIETQPEHLISDNTFFNTLAIIYSDSDASEIKQQFNTLEETLGRNRSDPMRSHKDRPADLDILQQSSVFKPEIFAKFDECYIRKVYSLEQEPVQLFLAQSLLGNRPSTVYLDRATGQIRVINNKIDGLKDWLKTRFIA